MGRHILGNSNTVCARCKTSNSPRWLREVPFDINSPILCVKCRTKDIWIKDKDNSKANRDKFKEQNPNYFNEWRTKNKDKVKANSLKFRKTLKGKFIQLKTSAKTTNKEVKLTFEEYVDIIQDNKCFYCTNSLAKFGHGLDKKDPNGIYEIDNVVACCWDCNRIKSDLLTFEEMIAIIKVIKEIRLNKILNNISVQEVK